jgi:hypothetical protein
LLQQKLARLLERREDYEIMFRCILARQTLDRRKRLLKAAAVRGVHTFNK